MINFDLNPTTTRPIDMMHQFWASHKWFETWQKLANDNSNSLSDQDRIQIQQGMLLYVDMLKDRITNP